MRALAMVIYIAAGIVSFFWSMHVIIQELGFLGGLVALMIIPITIAFTPFYVGFATGNWTLLAITYGGGILASVILAFSKDHE